MQETNAEIGREFGQMTGILVDTLVRVSAHRSGIGEVKCAPGFEPLVEQVLHQGFAQLDLGRLVQPRLRYVQDQEGAGDDEENCELDNDPCKSLCDKAS